MKNKPNVVCILIDDMGWRDLSYCGSNFYESPNIDRLCDSGMTFTRAYAACPVCSPSRASLLTGKYPGTLGTTNWIAYNNKHPRYGKLIEAPYINHLPTEERNLAVALKEAGYSTWHVGKWHLGTEEYYPDKVGFDVNIGGCHWGKPRNGYWMPCGIPTLPDGPEGEYLTDRVTDEAIALLKNRDKDTPFYLNLWYYDIHEPIQGKPEYVAYFEEKAKRMGLADKDPMEVGDYFTVVHRKDERLTRRLFQSHPGYAAVVYNLDMNVGRLIAALEEEGLMENTVILFTSDNGGLSTTSIASTCNAPAREGKGWIYDGGMRVPAFMVWRGQVREGSKDDTMICTPDFYPTILEAVGVPLSEDQEIDGVSLMPLLCETGKLEKRPLFWHYPHYSDQGGTPAATVIFEDYKLIQFFVDMHVEMYDLKNDPSESCDLSESMPEKAAELLTMLTEWQKKIEAKMPEPNPDYEKMFGDRAVKN